MKNILFRLTLVASSLFLSSCSNPSDPEKESLISSSSQAEPSPSSSSAISWPMPRYTSHDSLLLIDDFEDATDSLKGIKTPKGGYWFPFVDTVGGGSSTMEPLYDSQWVALNGQGYQSNGLLTFRYKLDKGAYSWAPYVAIGVSINGSSFDASAFAGFEYWFRGPAHRMRVEVDSVSDWDFHFLQQSASKTEWKKVVIDFAEVRQEGWGIPIPFTPNQIHFLTWELRGATGDSGTFEIDQLRFLDTIAYEAKNDMVIHDPEIPELDSMGDLSVNTDLNKRVIPYLTKGLNFINWLEDVKFDGSTWMYDEEDVIRHAGQGFKGLRLPIDLDLYVNVRDSVIAGTKSFAVDSLLWQVLDSFDIWTTRHGLSLTIDYHQYDGSFTGTSAGHEGYRSMAANLWKSLAAHFKNTSRDDLFFELTNEPNLGAGSNTISAVKWRALAQQMIDSIRTQHATIPIIYGATNFYGLDNLAIEDAFADSNIVYAFHFYEPFIFTHQGSPWSEIATAHKVPFPYTKEEWNTEYRYFGVMGSTPAWIKNEFQTYSQKGNRNYIMNRILKIKKWAHEKQVPLICNEWGAYQRYTKLEHLNNYNRTMGEIFTELGIAWQVWFGIFDTQGNLLPGLSESLKLEELTQ